MKQLCIAVAVLTWLALSMDAPAAKNETSTGNTRFAAYEGAHNWPTGSRAQVLNEFAVPIYIGLPTKAYRVLGRIYDGRTTGIELIGRAFDEAFDSERHRLRDCANQARLQGGDAVMVTDDPNVIAAFNLDRRQLRETTPLFHHRHEITLVIKFE